MPETKENKRDLTAWRGVATASARKHLSEQGWPLSLEGWFSQSL